MLEIKKLNDAYKAIEENQFTLFYLSRPECNLCKSLKPKVKIIIENYPLLKSYYINLNNDEQIAGQFSIFTIPAILVFLNGKEVIREARYFSINNLKAKLDRINNHF